MSAINTSLGSDKKNNNLIKKTKHFFSKKKSKHADNQIFESDTSFIDTKKDSNRTLITSNSENNVNDNQSLKQNKPETIDNIIDTADKGILSKSESLIDNDENFKHLQEGMDELDEKINKISNEFKKRSDEWQSNHAEISDRLNCMMWEMNLFRKEQMELTQKLNDELNGVKTSVSTETQNIKDELNGIKASMSTETQNLKDELNGVKASVSTETQNLKDELNGVKASVSTEAQKTLELRNNMEDIKAITEKVENTHSSQTREANENIMQQRSELQDLNSKLSHLQNEFEEIKEKVLSLSVPPSEESAPQKINVSDCDDHFIEYITRCVQEKMEQAYKLKKSEPSDDNESSSSPQEFMKSYDVKINELNEKLEEFQMYQMSREVELHRMKIKLDDSMDQFSQACGQQIKKKKNEKEELLRKINTDHRRRIMEVQEKMNASLVELKSSMADLKEEVYRKVDQQQDTIDRISQSQDALLLHQQSPPPPPPSQKKESSSPAPTPVVVEEAKEEEGDDVHPNLTEKFEKIQHHMDSLSDEIKMLNMETKVMSTNISLLWDDVRTMKNFIHQYDMNDKLKESETNEEISKIYSQINDLKKRLNDTL